MKMIGFFQEMDSGYPKSWGGNILHPGPNTEKYPVCDVVGYLKSGYPILDVMELTIDVIGGSFRVPGGSSVLTDGIFVWREDLSSYVEKYHINLPQDFLAAIQKNEFNIPPISREVLLQISVEASRALGFQPRP
ncbi:hypothetical protein [Streptomyces malaysiense]|uniref:hypothetical protein n=1 Tax=Streptomyces malaysiense TaxID=1428626 RepID=UPI000A78371A|nr:hypothetical protein [Streptomyces malaysiense]